MTGSFEGCKVVVADGSSGMGKGTPHSPKSLLEER